VLHCFIWLRNSRRLKVVSEGSLPGVAQPLLHGVDTRIVDLRLVHAAEISKRDRAMIRPDSRADAYSAAGWRRQNPDVKAADLEAGNARPT